MKASAKHLRARGLRSPSPRAPVVSRLTTYATPLIFTSMYVTSSRITVPEAKARRTTRWD
eukprot:11966713-Karenia_brevis.AAC.1